jgi:superfamily II RNA helicase
MGGLLITYKPKQIKKRRAEASKMETKEFMEGYKKYTQHYKIFVEELSELRNIYRVEDIVNDTVESVYKMLYDLGYIDDSNKLTIKGTLACRVSQCQELLLIEMLTRGMFDNLNAVQIACVLSVFSDIKLMDSDSTCCNKRIDRIVSDAIGETQKIAEELEKYENELGLIDLGSNWNTNTNLVEGTMVWVSGGSWQDVLNLVPTYSGNIIRELMKVAHLAEELIILLQMTNQQSVLVEAEKITGLIMRELVTVESLYLGRK